MPLNARNTRRLQNCLYGVGPGGIMEKVTLLKRNDDQQEGTVRALVLFRCRRMIIQKTGEPIHQGMGDDHTTHWQIPRTELDRVGVTYINALDRIVDGKGRYWQPEDRDVISVRLFENQLMITCRRVDPPAGPSLG